MAARKGRSWLEVTVKVSHGLEGAVGASLSSFVPSLMWQSEKKENGICLVKASVVMDARVDRIILEIEKALRQVEAKRLFSESLPVELRVFARPRRIRFCVLISRAGQRKRDTLSIRLGQGSCCTNRKARPHGIAET